jgi:hypothetical protein
MNFFKNILFFTKVQYLSNKQVEMIPTVSYHSSQQSCA